jgi:N-sulfoglucosamine sulfohydrolase
MSRRFAVISTVLAALGFAAPLAAADRLNLLIVTFDDMNADSAGYMGSKLGATPNLDAFAATAFVFEQAHVTIPICQPGRSAFMTGRVPHRNGALGFNPIRTDVPTLVEHLQAQGYFAAAIEKIPHMQPAAKFPWDLKLSGAGKNPALMRSHMEQCLQAAKAAGRPFFINANITDPHRPFPNSAQQANRKKKAANVPDPDTRSFRPEEVTVPAFLEDIPPVRAEVAEYFAGVARGDRSFGQIMAALKAAEHDGDTLVIVLSDHGMSFPFSKATVYRNGTWSPLLFRWPGLKQPGRDATNLVSSIDLLPTALEILELPAMEGIDGRTVLPLIRGESQPDRDYVVTHVNTVSSGKAFPQRCIRTKSHAYMWHGWVDGSTLFRVEAMNGVTFNALAKAGETDARIRQRVEQFQRGVQEQFFDLTADPDERQNDIADPANKAELDRLRALLLKQMEATDDPQLASFRSALAGK